MTELFIIGKNGQLGAELISYAKKHRISYVAYTKEELDITKYEKVREEIERVKPKIVFNTAAYLIPANCEAHPLLALDINAVAVKNLASICRDNGITFVTYSTDYVFDGKKGKPYIEVDSTNPLQMCGLSKLCGERAAINEYPKGTYIIRTCGVYGGETGSNSKGNFVLNILAEGKKKDVLEVSSEQVVSPTSARDLAEGSINLLRLHPEPGVYHLVNEGYCSWHDFTKKIFKYAHIKKKILPVNRKGRSGGVNRPKFSALKNKKAKKLGVVLPSIDDSLKNYIEQIGHLI